MENVKVANMSNGTISNAAKKQSPYWDACETKLLESLTLCVAAEASEPGESQEKIRTILNSHGPREIDALFEKLPPGHPASVPYAIFHNMPFQVYAAVVTGLRIRLEAAAAARER